MKILLIIFFSTIFLANAWLPPNDAEETINRQQRQVAVPQAAAVPAVQGAQMYGQTGQAYYGQQAGAYSGQAAQPVYSGQAVQPAYSGQPVQGAYSAQTGTASAAQTPTGVSGHSTAVHGRKRRDVPIVGIMEHREAERAKRSIRDPRQVPVPVPAPVPVPLPAPVPVPVG